MKNIIIEKRKPLVEGSNILNALIAVCMLLVLFSVVSCSQKTSELNSEWPTFNGDFNAIRYSPLTQITPQNVESIVKAGEYIITDTVPFQSGPVMIGKTLYFTTGFNTYAADAITGKLIWSHKFKGKGALLDNSRGVAYDNGKIFRSTLDAHVLAFDAKTGKVIWDVVAGNTELGEYCCAACLVWGGKVYVATAGSDVGAIGRVMALDEIDGHRLWIFDIVPAAGPGAETWPSDPNKLRAGGGVWSSFSLDTETGLLYVPTGNPGPDFVKDYRPGDNLYTCSVVMLDAATGKLSGYHQFVPNDYHDWDMASSPILFSLKSGEKMVAVAGKDGYLYGLDRKLVNVKYKIPITTIFNTDAPLTKEGTRFAPGTQGGVEWNGPAYSPALNALFVSSTDWASTLKLGAPEMLLNAAPGKMFLGTDNGFGDLDPVEKSSGWLTAVNAETGKVLWKYQAPKPMLAAVTPTASGLLFTGDLDGNLLAFDAASGKILLNKKVGGPIGGGIITYSIDGKQYIAVATGLNSYLFKTVFGISSIVIYSLPSKN
ncbi:MAG: PQQ-binding-like beta-propeller repeat protein [Ignavibacteria bacterium]|nr:PQQ-binding-like beta-propeller repeat protein [Ignavibacteria bacterium]